MIASSTTMNPIFKQTLAPLSVSWCLERLPVVVLIVCISFLQGFSLRFWAELLGSVGWGVSIGLEVIHIWAWFRAAVSGGMSRFAWMLLAVAATALLLAAALHEVTRPLLQESGRIEAAGQERESLQSESRVLMSNLEAYRDMSAVQGRRGWQDDIRRDTARLQIITGQLRKLGNAPGNTARRPWLTKVTHGGVIAVAVLFQIAAVLAVWTLSVGSRKIETPFRVENAKSRNEGNVSPPVSETPETFRTPSKQQDTGFYRELWSQIETHATGNSARLARGNGKCSQAALARDLGINPPDLSAIKLIAQGQQVPRNPSRESVERLAKRFEIEIPK
ncbi:MAG: helix-turn-helix transcriptional regulator [Planctomycetes bacterium]|nr:helix-turn-helix transcriptional regulator [Planctomycetota bacterium]